ncbi:MAG: DUF433 domain-containing protein [Planctomycetota bacterium]|nr:DUF433 domain-containing protein [Planctomycetota bacterium]
MVKFERISVDPAIMRGRPCIRGTRIPVSTILGMLAKGHSRERILEGYPDLKPEDIDEALAYASWRMTESEVHA